MGNMRLSEDQLQGLIRQVTKGSSQAYAQLIGQFERPVFSMCLQMLKDRDLATDAAQEAFISAYEKLHTFRMDAKFSTWLYRIAFNQCGSMLRKLKRRPEISWDETDQEIAQESSGTDWSAYEAKEKQQMVHSCIRELAYDDQMVLQLFYLEEQSLEEMEKITGINRNTLKVKLHRARQRLEKKLIKSMVTLN